MPTPKDPSNRPREISWDEFVRVCRERRAAGEPPLELIGAELDGVDLDSDEPLGQEEEPSPAIPPTSRDALKARPPAPKATRIRPRQLEMRFGAERRGEGERRSGRERRRVRADVRRNGRPASAPATPRQIHWSEFEKLAEERAAAGRSQFELTQVRRGDGTILWDKSWPKPDPDRIVWWRRDSDER